MEQNREPQNKTQVSMVNYYLTKGAQAYNGLKIVSLINGVGRTGLVHAKKMKLGHQLTPYTSINSNWTKNLNISYLIPYMSYPSGKYGQ